MNLLLIVSIFSNVTVSGFDPALVEEELDPLVDKLSRITGYPREVVLYKVFGDLHFSYVPRDTQGYSCWSWLTCYGKNPLEDPNADGLLIHELGHRFLNDLHLTFEQIDLNIAYGDIHVAGINSQHKFERTALGYPHPGQPYEQHGSLSPNYNTYQEDFADMFMNWARDSFADDEPGHLRYQWMDRFVKKYLYEQGHIIKRSRNLSGRLLRRHAPLPR